VRYVPEWFPGAGFQLYAKQARIDHRRMRDNPITIVQAGMVCYSNIYFEAELC
jgi:hypothetical protein